MMTSSNGNIFRVTGLLCWEFTGHRWIPRTKASDAELWCFHWSAPKQTVEQIMETPGIWDAIALIMTSLQCDTTSPVSGVLVENPSLQSHIRLEHADWWKTSNGSWCIGIKGEMSGTVCVTFTWDIYIYIWVAYSFCLFCCLFIIVTWWYIWCIVSQVASQRK